MSTTRKNQNEVKTRIVLIETSVKKFTLNFMGVVKFPNWDS
jgi:hypothetical protein